jgi:hypothetical protein
MEAVKPRMFLTVVSEVVGLESSFVSPEFAKCKQNMK